MSFAFVTILLFIVVLPGIAFKSGYFSTEFAIGSSNRSLVDNLFWATIPSLLLHIAGLNIAHCFTGYKINIELISDVFLQTNNHANVHNLLDNFNQNVTPICVYISWISLTAIPLGHFSRILIRSFRIDVSFRILRFPNKWCYLLTGESLAFPGKNYGKNVRYLIDTIFVDALVRNNSESIIYRGVLLDFHVDKDGKLETLILRSVHKKKFDLENKEEKKNIFPCSQFILPYNQIINLNIRYLTLNVKGFSLDGYRTLVKRLEIAINLKGALNHVAIALMFSIVAYCYVMPNCNPIFIIIPVVTLSFFIFWGDQLKKKYEALSQNIIDEFMMRPSTGEVTLKTIGFEEIAE